MTECRNALALHYGVLYYLVMVAALLTAGPLVGAQQPAPSPGRVSAGPVEVTQFADTVVVFVKDLDLLRTRHRKLEAELKLAGSEGEGTRRVDLQAEYQHPAIILAKKTVQPYQAVAVTLRGDGNVLFEQRVALGPVISAEPAISVTDQPAHIEPGQAMGTPPVIRQPDLSKLADLAVIEAKRQHDLSAVQVNVVSDVNYPLGGGAGPISRQTDHPDDPSRRSLYLPFKSQVYDAATGEPASNFHYLVEVPLKPEWASGAGDETITLGAEDIKLHVPGPSQTFPVNGKPVRINGDSIGALGQAANTVAIDDRGNIYYSASSPPAEVVRFNIHTQRWEAPPINPFSVFDAMGPKPEEIEAASIKGTSWDAYKLIAVARNRVFLLPSRSRLSGDGKVSLAGIVSMPIDHWDNAEAFKKDLRVHVTSWPGEKPSFFRGTWPEAGDERRRVTNLYETNGDLFAVGLNGTGYGPWRLELTPEGETKSFKEFRTPEEQAEFKKLETRTGPRPLPASAKGLLSRGTYGQFTFTRAGLQGVLTEQPSPTPAKGTVNVYYDLVAKIRQNPQKFAALFDGLTGPSLALSWMAAEIPDKPGHVLGTGEYGYYLAELDLSTAETGTVKKTYLKADLGDTAVESPMTPELGPYTYLWLQDGNTRWLYVAGYSGYVRIPYCVDGKVLPRFRVDNMSGKFKGVKVLDQATDKGSAKWVKCLMPGLDKRVFSTAIGQAARGGTPYSGGLVNFNRETLGDVERLSYLSRTHDTRCGRSRVVYHPNGAAVQDLVLAAGPSEDAYVHDIEKEKLPGNLDPKVFLYQYHQGGTPQDRFGFSLPIADGKGALYDVAFSRDRRYLVIIENLRLLTFDTTANQYIDGRTLLADVWGFQKPACSMFELPDGRLMVCTQQKDAATATFSEVRVSAEGRLSLEPMVTLKGADAKAFAPLHKAAIAVVADPAGDGSYDLFLGPDSAMPATHAWVIRDIVGPRK